MSIARGVSGAILFAAATLPSPAPASANEPITGIYTYNQARMPQMRWTVYPTCVPADRNGTRSTITASVGHSLQRGAPPPTAIKARCRSRRRGPGVRCVGVCG